MAYARRQGRANNPQYRYIGDGMAESHELKLTLHRVRTHFDQMPREVETVTGTDGEGNATYRVVNPRKERQVRVPAGDQGFLTVDPHLAVAERHFLTTGQYQPRARHLSRGPSDGRYLKTLWRQHVAAMRPEATISLRQFAHAAVAFHAEGHEAAARWLQRKQGEVVPTPQRDR